MVASEYISTLYTSLVGKLTDPTDKLSLNELANYALDVRAQLDLLLDDFQKAIVNAALATSKRPIPIPDFSHLRVVELRNGGGCLSVLDGGKK